MTDGHLSENLIIDDSLRAKTMRRLHPGWGWCAQCGMPWAIRAEHTTEYEPNRGMFPLCVPCWDRLNTEDKLFAYRVYLLDIEDSDRWPQVKAALLNELGDGVVEREDQSPEQHQAYLDAWGAKP